MLGSSSPVVSAPNLAAGGTITGNLAQTGATTFSTGTGAVSLNGDTTVATAKALAVTTADKLTVGSVIIPQTKTIVWSPFATDLTQAFFIADEAYQVTAVRAVFGVASISGTLQIEKLTSTTVPGSGTSMLTGTLSLAGTANTVLSGTLSGTVGNLQLAAGDRIGGVLAGTLTSLLGAVVTLTLKRI